MNAFLDSLLAFLLKYPPRVFEKGTLVWQGAGSARALVPLALVAGGVALVTYQRARARSRPRDRVVLSLLRLAIFAVLVICLFRPALVLSISVPQRNALGILLDDSKSMEIRDLDSLSRLEVVRRTFGDSTARLVSRLSERFVLRYYRFAETVGRIPSPAALSASGSRTDIAKALDESRRDLAGIPLAGLILVSDGADNAGSALAEPLLSLRGARVPVYTVGIGRERFARDLAVDRVELPRTSLKDAALLGGVVLRQRGMSGQKVSVVVQDGGRIVATREVELPKDGEVVTARVRVPAAEAGVRQLRFSVKPLPGEVVTQNNAVEAVIRVRDRREKILYLEGEPRPEFAFLRRAAAGDSNLQVVGLQRTADGKFLRLGVDDSLELVKGFPTTREELFRYRGLILGSIEAGFFTLDQLRMIADFVGERGGGLLSLGGRRAYGEGGFAGTPVAEVLPLLLDESRRAGADSAPAVELKVRPAPAGLANAALQLGTTEEANRVRWDSMPPLTSVNRIRGLKPGATTLLVGGPAGGPAGEVVFASQRYGRGKALALTVQDTWLWRMHASVPVEDRSHQTFWRQLLRWLLEDVPDRLEVTTTPEHASPRQRVTVRAELADSTFLKVNDAVVLARITAPSGDTLALPLEWALGRDGTYAGEFTAHEEGRYRIDVEASRGRDTVRAEPELLLVADQGLDYLNAEMRAPLLKRIAEETGGRFYTPETLERLPEDVVYTQSGVTVTEARDLWDMPAVFLLLLLLLGAEWGYRRKRGLV